MDNKYTINIKDGTSNIELLNNTYSVSSNIPGYDNNTINPSSITIIDGTNDYNFTIGATGILTLHVTEEGNDTSKPITNATFIRTDSKGNKYGEEIITDNNGDAIFENIPYSIESSPTIYFLQTSSDNNHEYSKNIQSTIMNNDTKTIQISNKLPVPRNITITDANYKDLPIIEGTITLN